MKALADYVHKIGFKFGIYTDRGTATCVGRPGSQGYETIDAQTYAKWGVDFVKEASVLTVPRHAPYSTRLLKSGMCARASFQTPFRCCFTLTDTHC